MKTAQPRRGENDECYIKGKVCCFLHHVADPNLKMEVREHSFKVTGENEDEAVDRTLEEIREIERGILEGILD